MKEKVSLDICLNFSPNKYCVAGGNPIINRERVGIPLPVTGFILSHVCAYPKQETGCPTSYVMVYFSCSMIWGERWLLVLMILVELLTITVYAFFTELEYYTANLSNPTHQGTKEMCQIVQDVRENSCFISVNIDTSGP